MTDYAALAEQAAQLDDLSRRDFLRVLGASIALAGLDGCTRMPAEKILPYVQQPPELTPGVPLHFATSMVLDGFATGLIVESHEGRPTKIEGNPAHPASLGAAGALEQAWLLQLYDPHRARVVRQGGRASSWASFAAAFSPAGLASRIGARGAGLRLLLEPTGSPFVGEQLTRLRQRYPAMGVHFHAPLAPWSSGVRGATPALLPQYDLRAADVIVAVDADLLGAGPFHLRHARAFADGRRDPLRSMNRLYVVEPSFTVTGNAADHRLPVRPSSLEHVLDALYAAVGGRSPSALPSDVPPAWIDAVAKDLLAHRGRGLVVAGERTTPRAQALAAALNGSLGNVGKAVRYTASPLLGAGDQAATLDALLAAIDARSVDTLIVLGGNPSYATAGAADFARRLRTVPNRAYVGLFENETARDCDWFVPAAHGLESWSDAVAYDGTLSLVQPLVQPLFGGRQISEVLAALDGVSNADPYTLLRTSWQSSGRAADDAAWAAVLRAGVLEGSASPTVTAASRSDLVAAATTPAHEGIEVVFRPDARVHDGAFADNPWLQELPDPITKLTWDNAAQLAPQTAQRLGVSTGDLLSISRGGATVRIPALIVAGHAAETVTLPFGYGRSGAEEVARNVGVNVYPLWPGAGNFAVSDATVARDGGHRELAITQGHFSLEGRDAARAESLEALQARAHTARPRRRELTLYEPEHPQGTSPQQWAMTIDLATCIGCNGCVVACQAENNIPVVGRDEVARGREMHWLRIDRYLDAPSGAPALSQPMLCQQCEKAPCEYVCPVGATVHSPDGLNEMVYNRCVGTRFCSNNCPYKVRRFNWFDFNAELAETERMAKNPDVTVRERGVMEKCTFCVQRIREAEIAAQVEGRPLRGSDVTTACAQACPTNAIVFGSLTESNSAVVQRRADSRAYAALGELGTEPRVQYLTRVRNVNPALESAS